MQAEQLGRGIGSKQAPGSSLRECSAIQNINAGGTGGKASKGFSKNFPSKSEPEVLYEEDEKGSPVGCNWLGWSQHSSFGQNSNKHNPLTRSNSLKQSELHLAIAHSANASSIPMGTYMYIHACGAAFSQCICKDASEHI